MPGSTVASLRANRFDKTFPVYTVPALLFVLELVLPLLTSSYWFLRIIMFCNIFVIYAITYDLLAGFAGQISMGHSMFFGGAGYVAALLNLNLGTNLLICILIGCIGAILSGILLGYICLRLRGPYLGVVTLVAPLVLITIVHVSPSVLGGDNGISGFSILAEGALRTQFYIVLVITMVVFILMLYLTRGEFGLILKTIREDENGAEAAGVNTTKYKVLAFVISGGFAGLAGILFILVTGSVGPMVLDPHYSIMPIVMIYLGGASSIVGPAIGAYLLTFLDQYMLNLPYVRVMIWAAALIVILRFLPSGIIGLPYNIRRLAIGHTKGRKDN